MLLYLHEESIGYSEYEHPLYDYTKQKYKKEYVQYVINKYNGKKVIALTFDDGPSKYTKALLEILNSHDVKATFFLLGYKIRGNEDTILKVASFSHDIGIHGYSHKLFTRLDEKEVEYEINETTSILKDVINKNINYIRVPYGITNETNLKKINELNLIPVLWHIDSKDWKLKNSKKIANNVIKHAGDRKIILMHDTYRYSVNAVDAIITQLKDSYSFVTLTELTILNTYLKY